MKTSRKILLCVAALVLLLLIGGLIVLRNDLQVLHAKEASLHKFKIVSTSDFKALDFSGYLFAEIRQGSAYKVEVEEDSSVDLRLEAAQDTLHLRVESNRENGTNRQIRIRITMPAVQFIKAAQDTKLFMHRFDIDSLKVFLQDSASFTGNGNKIKHVSFQTAGKAQIEFERDPNEL